MIQRDQGDYEEQMSLYQYEDDWEVDAKELCRKPKEACKPRDFYVLIDTSGASGAVEGNLQLAKIAVRSLLKCLSPEERIELSTSSEHGARLLRRMTREEVDELEFETKLDGLEVAGASQLFDNVLQRVADLDDLGDREVTVVVVAGSADDDWASTGIMNDLGREMQRRNKLHFAFLGLNLPAEIATELRGICQPLRNASFAELRRPAAQIDGLFSSKLSAKHALEIDIRKPCPAAAMGLPVDFTVVIRNHSDTPIPSGSRLYLNPNGYFRSSFVDLPEIGMDRTHGVVLRAYPRGRVGIFDLEERCEVAIQTRDKTPIANQPFFLDMVDFLGELGGKRHPLRGRSLNLWVVGAKGSGKGSFINTLLTLLSDGDCVITAGADVGGGAGHQTDRLMGFNIGKTMRSTRLPRFPFRIFDTWGMDEESYKGLELETMLRGQLPLGWHMAENVDEQGEVDRERLSATAHQREAHAIFFFVAFGEVENQESVQCLQAHFQKVKSLGFNPMVVLARVDELEPAIREDPLNWDLPKVARLRRQLADMLKVGLANVLVSVPYVTQDSLERSFKIEKLAYHNLRCGLDAAVQYLKTTGRKKEKGGGGSATAAYVDDEDDDEDDDEEEVMGGFGFAPPPRSYMSSDTASQSSVGSSTSSSRHTQAWPQRDPYHGHYRMPPPHRQHHYAHGGPPPRHVGQGGYYVPSSPASSHGATRGGRPHPPPPLPQHPHDPRTARQEWVSQSGEEEEPVLVPSAAEEEAAQRSSSSSSSRLTEEQFRAQYYEPRRREEEGSRPPA